MGRKKQGARGKSWKARWYYQILITLLIVLTTSCNNQPQQSDVQGTANEDTDDPYGRFIQSINSLEPQLEDSPIENQFRRKQQTKDENEVKLPQVKPLEVEGNIVIAGAGTIEPLNELMYERFVQQGYAGIIDLNSIGTNSAIELFCQQKDFDLVTITRTLKNSEIAACTAKGIQPVGFRIGKNALMIVVNRQDTFVKKVTMSQVAAILTREKWSNINPNWPDKSIQRFLTTPSVALDLILEKAFPGNSQPTINPLNTKSYKNDESIIQNISNIRYGVGILSNVAYQRSSRTLRAIPLNGVAATSETVKNGTYPLSQTLLIYTDINRLKQKPQVSAFINFYLSHVNEEIVKAGLLSIGQQELNQSKMKWLEIMKFQP
ncbi:MAG: substrate-binding domain-containing protein [Calothrix sp. MO_167.B42]|nr:substrate-binding domain-containing protein [Calothrix sp. MO_167.B42]